MTKLHSYSIFIIFSVICVCGQISQISRNLIFPYYSPHTIIIQLTVLWRLSCMDQHKSTQILGSLITLFIHYLSLDMAPCGSDHAVPMGVRSMYLWPLLGIYKGTQLVHITTISSTPLSNQPCSRSPANGWPSDHLCLQTDLWHESSSQSSDGFRDSDTRTSSTENLTRRRPATHHQGPSSTSGDHRSRITST